MTQAFQAAVDTLQRQAPRGLRWRALIIQGANHGNNAEQATPVALQWASRSGTSRWASRSGTSGAVLPIEHVCANGAPH